MYSPYLNSDKFKLRRLNANKLFKALKGYYEESLREDESIEESKKAGFLFDKFDLVEIQRNKNQFKI